MATQPPATPAPRTLSEGYSDGCAGAAMSQMHSSPSAAPDAKRLGLNPLNSRPLTCKAVEAHGRGGVLQLLPPGEEQHPLFLHWCAGQIIVALHALPKNQSTAPRRRASASSTAMGWIPGRPATRLDSTGRWSHPPNRQPRCHTAGGAGSSGTGRLRTRGALEHCLTGEGADSLGATPQASR